MAEPGRWRFTAMHDAPWHEHLEPLARAFAARFAAHLPILTYPIRVGTHFDSIPFSR